MDLHDNAAYCEGCLRTPTFVYTGRLLNGEPSGTGVGEWTTGALVRYTGQWINGLPAGAGAGQFRDGTTVDGDWLAGRPHGPCTRRAENGTVEYAGDYAEGVYEGEGTLYFNDGTRYTGLFSDGQRCGHGTLVSVDGDAIYTGEWCHDQPHGKGTFYGEDGTVYTGCFDHGVRSGRGTMVWPAGGVYEGEWAQGAMHGTGVLRGAGQTLTGGWSQGRPHGPALVLGPSRLQWCTFTNGVAGGWAVQVGVKDGTTYAGETAAGVPRGAGARLTAPARVHGVAFLGLDTGALAEPLRERTRPIDPAKDPFTLEVGNFDNIFLHGEGIRVESQPGWVLASAGVFDNGQLVCGHSTEYSSLQDLLSSDPTILSSVGATITASQSGLILTRPSSSQITLSTSSGALIATITPGTADDGVHVAWVPSAISSLSPTPAPLHPLLTTLRALGLAPAIADARAVSSIGGWDAAGWRPSGGQQLHVHPAAGAGHVEVDLTFDPGTGALLPPLALLATGGGLEVASLGYHDVRLAGSELLGSGFVVYTTGQRYEGAVAGTRPHGLGTMEAPDGTRATGRWEQGRLCDTSELLITLPSGSEVRSSGLTVDGDLQASGAGVATLQAPDGSHWTYVGEIVANKPHGRGKATEAGGRGVRDGNWVAGSLLGHALIVNGSSGGCGSEFRYEGEAAGWAPAGRGRGECVPLACGATADWYEGEWAEGQPHGAGRASFPGTLDPGLPALRTAGLASAVAAGTWVEGELEGEVEIVWSDGRKLVGTWAAGAAAGAGVFSWIGGSTMSATWTRGQLDGPVSLVLGSDDCPEVLPPVPPALAPLRSYHGTYVRGLPEGLSVLDCPAGLVLCDLGALGGQTPTFLRVLGAHRFFAGDYPSGKCILVDFDEQTVTIAAKSTPSWLPTPLPPLLTLRSADLPPAVIAGEDTATLVAAFTSLVDQYADVVRQNTSDIGYALALLSSVDSFEGFPALMTAIKAFTQVTVSPIEKPLPDLIKSLFESNLSFIDVISGQFCLQLNHSEAWPLCAGNTNCAVLAAPAGDIYVGNITDIAYPTPCGSGTLTLPSGIVYTGTFTAGAPGPAGRISWPDGSTYEGAVSGLTPAGGAGRLELGGGVVLGAGQWVGGRPRGPAQVVFESMACELTAVIDDDGRFVGRGTVTSLPTGSHLATVTYLASNSTGTEGEGGAGGETLTQQRAEVTYTDGSVYVGSVSRGLVREGQGRLVRGNGMVLEGEWSDNALAHGSVERVSGSVDRGVVDDVAELAADTALTISALRSPPTRPVVTASAGVGVPTSPFILPDIVPTPALPPPPSTLPPAHPPPPTHPPLPPHSWHLAPLPLPPASAMVHYRGDFTLQTQPTGLCSIEYSDGSTYTGENVSYVRTGAGTLTLVTGEVLAGVWAGDAWQGGQARGQDWAFSGELNGHCEGEFETQDGRTYKGSLFNGEPSGLGVEQLASGERYSGAFAGGRRHGRGRADYEDGSYYDGEWEQGQWSGQGVLERGGVRYEGGFKEGRRFGAGVETNNGREIRGIWK